jgi:hypothetical protein
MSEDQKTVLQTEREKAELAAIETNKTRTGVGTRVAVGATRGKNPQVITFEHFDDSIPESLPKSVAQFMEVVTSKEAELVDYLIRGLNDANYESASDPLKEFVVASWAADVQSTFRQAVRNYSRGLQIPLEDAVNIIRPGFVSKFGE